MIKKVESISQINKEMFAMPWSIYPYANFLRYGVDKDFYSLYLIDDVLFTKYYDSVQVCSKAISELQAKEISSFVLDNIIRMVSGPTECLEKIFALLGRGRIENGHIFELDSFNNNCVSNITLATEIKAFKEIAVLVCDANSSNTGYYGLEQYFDQIYSRYSEGYCRNWVYIANSKIVGHIATYAEAEGYAVLGGLAVDKDYRGQGIAKALLNNAINDMKSENKKSYAFCYNHNLLGFYLKISKSSFKSSKIMLK